MLRRLSLGGVGLLSIVAVALLVLWPQALKGATDHAAMAMEMRASASVRLQVSSCTARGCHALSLVRRGSGYVAVAAHVAAVTATDAITNFTFVPKTLTINAGDTVTWVNQDAAAHTSTSDPGSTERWGSPSLATGQSFSHTFNTAGTFTYHCDFHPNMTASIVVQGSGATAPPATATAAPAATPPPPAATATSGGGAAPSTGSVVALQASLNGAREVNAQGTAGQGSMTGSGTATVLVNTALGQLCYTLSVTNVTLPAAAAHIHNALSGANGNVVVPFSAPDASGTATGCVSNVSPTLLADIAANPAAYYVNVHTSDFPAGAVRGQLQAAATVALQANLNGANEVNAQGTAGQGSPTGSGTAAVLVNAALGQLCYTLSVTNVTLPAAAAHIHVAAAGANGNVVVPLIAPGATGVASGCVSNADPTLLAAITANPANYYVNVHTSDFPAGAVRGQLGAGAPPAAPAALQANLNGANEVNAQGTAGQGSPTGSGTAAVLIAAALDQLCYTLSVTNVTLPAAAAHIHVAAAGANGNVVVPLIAPGATGVASGCVSNVSPVLLAAIMANPAGYYVNVHTSDFPAGAVRGQLVVPAPPAPSTATATPVPPTAVPTTQPSATSVPATATSVPPTPTSVPPTAFPIPTAVELHNAPRTVVGGHAAECDLATNLQQLTSGCLIVSSITYPGARVVYTLTYPGGSTSPQTFTDTADPRGHSLHIFGVAYLPPAGAHHGAAATIVGITASATLPDGSTITATPTRFVVIGK